MTLRSLGNIRGAIGSLILFGVVLITMVTPKYGGDIDRSSAKNDELASSLQSIRVGDKVFYSSSVQDYFRNASKDSDRLSMFSDQADFDMKLAEHLNSLCDNQPPTKNSYIVWDNKNYDEFVRLSEVIRTLYFFYSFEGVEPKYSDSIFKLNIRQKKIDDYCEVRKIQKMTNINSVIAIVDSSDFSPLHGSVTTNDITWLPNDSHRNIDYEKLEVKNWETIFALIPRAQNGWSYYQTEKNIYQNIFNNLYLTDTIIILRADTGLGDVSGEYLQTCTEDPQLPSFSSDTFIQLCKK